MVGGGGAGGGGGGDVSISMPLSATMQLHVNPSIDTGSGRQWRVGHVLVMLIADVTVFDL